MEVFDPELCRAVRVALTAELQTDLARLDEQCPHPHEQRYMCEVRIGDGRTQWRWQCGRCFALIGPACKPPGNGEPVRSHAEGRHEHLLSISRAKRDLVLLEHSRRQRAEYDAYLASAAWQERREKVLLRDGYRCQACGERDATQVHHLTYARVFSEPLFDLVAVCAECHEGLHE